MEAVRILDSPQSTAPRLGRASASEFVLRDFFFHDVVAAEPVMSQKPQPMTGPSPSGVDLRSDAALVEEEEVSVECDETDRLSGKDQKKAGRQTHAESCQSDIWKERGPITAHGHLLQHLLKPPLPRELPFLAGSVSDVLGIGVHKTDEWPAAPEMEVSSDLDMADEGWSQALIVSARAQHMPVLPEIATEDATTAVQRLPASQTSRVGDGFSDMRGMPVPKPEVPPDPTDISLVSATVAVGREGHALEIRPGHGQIRNESGVDASSRSELATMAGSGSDAPLPGFRHVREAEILPQLALSGLPKRSEPEPRALTEELLVTTFARAAIFRMGGEQLPARMRVERLGAELQAVVIAGLRNAGQKLIQIQWDPIELGRVRILLQMTETGLHIQIMAERPETLDLMRRFSADLMQDMEKMGYSDLMMSFSDQQDRDLPADPKHLVVLAEDDPEGAVQIRRSPVIYAESETCGMDLRI